MKLFSAILLSASVASTSAFTPSCRTINRAGSALNAKIRDPTEKNKVLEFGWDGTTALGGAVDDSKPARLLDEIRASGETQSDACELFNANLGTCDIMNNVVHIVIYSLFILIPL